MNPILILSVVGFMALADVATVSAGFGKKGDITVVNYAPNTCGGGNCPNRNVPQVVLVQPPSGVAYQGQPVYGGVYQNQAAGYNGLPAGHPHHHHHPHHLGRDAAGLALGAGVLAHEVDKHALHHDNQGPHHHHYGRDAAGLALGAGVLGHELDKHAHHNGERPVVNSYNGNYANLPGRDAAEAALSAGVVGYEINKHAPYQGGYQAPQSYGNEAQPHHHNHHLGRDAAGVALGAGLLNHELNHHAHEEGKKHHFGLHAPHNFHEKARIYGEQPQHHDDHHHHHHHHLGRDALGAAVLAHEVDKHVLHHKDEQAPHQHHYGRDAAEVAIGTAVIGHEVNKHLLHHGEHHGHHEGQNIANTHPVSTCSGSHCPLKQSAGDKLKKLFHHKKHA